MANTPPHLEEVMAALREMSGMPSLGSLALDHPQLVAALKAFDPIKVVTACGGLLTVPQLQSKLPAA